MQILLCAFAVAQFSSPVMSQDAALTGATRS